LPYPKSKTKPWDNQLKFWEFAKNFKGSYAAFDMGAGKSKTAIDYANGIDAKSVIIICPKKVIDVWPHQFKLHSYNTYHFLLCDKGNSTRHAEDIKKFISASQSTERRYVVIINYDSFWRPPVGPVYNNRNMIINNGVLMSYEWDLLIPDESHRAKSPGGKASWGLMRLAKKARRKLFLSGTPMPHSPLDIYAQYRAMDPSIFGTSFVRFKRHYCIMGGYENRQVIKYINLNELHKKFFSRAMHVSIDDVVDIPKAQSIEIECDLNPKTKKVYHELDKEFIAEVDIGEISVKGALDKIMRLQQIAGGYVVLDDGKSKVIDNSKIDTTIEIIQDIDLKEPVVIFCRFVNEINRLKERLKKIGRTVGIISGQRQHKNPEDFKNGIWSAKINNALIVQVQAGGEGIDLTATKYCIFLSKGFSLGQFNQCFARVRRPGQKRKTVFYHITAKGTVDKKIMRAIDKKEEVVNYILKDIKGNLGKNISPSNPSLDLKNWRNEDDIPI